jgi:hypothetical protein
LKKEIVAFAVLICLALTSIQPALADTVSAPTIYGPFLGMMARARAPSQFYLAFINMTEASVSLGLVSGVETYTFEMTMKYTPPDWMTPAWHPSFAPPLGKIVIFEVLYEWSIWDTSGRFYGLLRIHWNLPLHANEGTVKWDTLVCPPTIACENAHIGAQVSTDPSTLKLSISGKSVSLTISQTDLVDLFPTLLSPETLWRCSSHAIYGSDFYYITERTSLPT